MLIHQVQFSRLYNPQTRPITCHALLFQAAICCQFSFGSQQKELPHKCRTLKMVKIYSWPLQLLQIAQKSIHLNNDQIMKKRASTGLSAKDFRKIHTLFPVFAADITATRKIRCNFGVRSPLLDKSILRQIQTAADNTTSDDT